MRDGLRGSGWSGSCRRHSKLKAVQPARTALPGEPSLCGRGSVAPLARGFSRARRLLPRLKVRSSGGEAGAGECGCPWLLSPHRVQIALMLAAFRLVALGVGQSGAQPLQTPKWCAGALCQIKCNTCKLSRPVT